MKKISTRILCWCNNPEEGAIDQARNIENHPCLSGNICLMPDTHQGYGMPIGGVVALKNAVSPNMVGVDIGCGIIAVRTSLTEISTEELKRIMGYVRSSVPVGKNHQLEAQKDVLFQDLTLWDLPVCGQEIGSAKKQLGTLGGGNHFIEIQKGDDGRIWFMIHTGSRNLGYKVANHYNNIAKQLCSQWRQDDVVKNDLAFLPVGTEAFVDYLKEMDICLKFAYANRIKISEKIKEAFEIVFFDISFSDAINIHHNYASLENHYDGNVYVHRKGAVLARKGTIGIIAGSQGTSSYIVEGLGSKSSLQSCSHGAGRTMSRTKAQENLNLEEEIRILNEKGVIHNIRNKKDLDEAPSAYKDIDIVMNEQSDLVKILVKLTPLAVVKG